MNGATEEVLASLGILYIFIGEGEEEEMEEYEYEYEFEFEADPAELFGFEGWDDPDDLPSWGWV